MVPKLPHQAGDPNASPYPIHADLGATPSGSSQGKEAWALRAICGCLTDSRAEVNFPFSILGFGLFLIPLIPVSGPVPGWTVLLRTLLLRVWSKDQ